MPLWVILGLIVLIAACGDTANVVGNIEGFDILAEPGAKVPQGIQAVIRAVQESKPTGGRALVPGTIRIYPGPFDCGYVGMKVWGCGGSPTDWETLVSIAYTEHAADGALVEELGHFMWGPVCGYCESWTATGGGRNADFEEWIRTVRAKAKLAVA